MSINDPQIISLVAGFVVGYLICAAIARSRAVRDVLYIGGAVLVGFVLWQHGAAALEYAATDQVRDLFTVTEAFGFGAVIGGILGCNRRRYRGDRDHD